MTNVRLVHRPLRAWGASWKLSWTNILAKADRLNLSPGYLSDMLRALTGQNAQQLIHYKLVEKAKDILSTTDLSIAEIAYPLGFEHPQAKSD